MEWFNIALARLRAIWRRDRVINDINEEMRLHVEMETQTNIDRGMRPAEAYGAALRSFGNMGRIRDIAYEIRGGGMIETLLQDTRYGWRMLLKHPGFTFVAVLTLGLSIGANTAIFSVVNGVLLKPLPYPEPERLERVFLQNSPTNRFGLSVADVQALEKNYQQTALVAAFRSQNITLTGGEVPEQIPCTFATGPFFKTLGVAPMLGRTFLPGEDRPGTDRVVVISHDFWQRRFAASPAAIGQHLTLDGVSYTIIGVMPPDFMSPEGGVPELWPILQLETPKRRGPFYLRVITRRNAGVSEQHEREALLRVARELFPQWSSSFTDANATYVAVPLKQVFTKDFGTTLFVLLGAVGCVLLIASVNVANLLIAKTTARQQEIAIRAALGAGRLRLVRQMLTESILLAVLGGATGLLLAVWGVHLLLALGPNNIPRLDEVKIDGWVLGFAALSALFSCLVFGLPASLYSVSPNLGDPLKGGGRGSSEVPGRRRLRDLLVVSEFALALPLLVGAGLMIHSFLKLQQVNPGFEPDHLLMVQLPLPALKYSRTEQAVNFHKELLRRIETLPGVKSASISTNLPLVGGETNNFNLEIRPTPPGESETVAEFMAVSPEYFRTLGVPLLKGRYLSEQDTADAQPVMVISQAMARRYFPTEDPIGMRLKTGGCRECDWTTIVGVVGDVKNEGLSAEDDSAMYCPFVQEPSNIRMMTLIVRAEVDPTNMVPAIRREVNSIDPDLALADIKTMDRLVSASLGPSRYRVVLLGIFATAALLLAAIGIYGVSAYAVSQRTHEIGIRIALGAQKRDILRLVVGQGMILSLIGVALGVAASVALTRSLSSLLYGVSSTDPVTFVAVVLLLIGVALLACYVPARRATNIDPMIALRNE